MQEFLVLEGASDDDADVAKPPDVKIPQQHRPHAIQKLWRGRFLNPGVSPRGCKTLSSESLPRNGKP